MYRLDWIAFQELLDLIAGDIATGDEKMAKVGNCGTVVQPAVKLAVTLRYEGKFRRR